MMPMQEYAAGHGTHRPPALGGSPRHLSTGRVGGRSLRPRLRARCRRAVDRQQFGPTCSSTRARIFRRGSRRSKRRSTTSCSRATSSPTTPSGASSSRRSRRRREQGVRVCVVYDWLGSTQFGGPWAPLREAGAEVRCFNPPSVDSPLAWLTRDHRKSIVVDGEIAFVSGLCVSAKWNGDPRDGWSRGATRASRLRGDAVADIEEALSPGLDRVRRRAAARRRGASKIAIAGDVRVRVIAGVPGSASTYRTRSCSSRRSRASTCGSPMRTSSERPRTRRRLRAAARDGVDVRLLVPGASDVPAVSPLSRAGYRALLEAGVRVFEWNGTMLHAKTAVADRRWSRVGSTNLNLVSWMSNYELDVAIEDVDFAEAMARAVRGDLARVDRDRADEPQSGAADRAARSGRAGSERRCAARDVGQRGTRGGGCGERGKRAGRGADQSPHARSCGSRPALVRRNCDGVHRDPGRVVPALARVAARGAVRLARCSVGVESVDALAQIEGEVEAAGADARPSPGPTRGEERTKAGIIDSSRP